MLVLSLVLPAGVPGARAADPYAPYTASYTGSTTATGSLPAATYSGSTDTGSSTTTTTDTYLSSPPTGGTGEALSPATTGSTSPSGTSAASGGTTEGTGMTTPMPPPPAPGPMPTDPMDMYPDPFPLPAGRVGFMMPCAGMMSCAMDSVTIVTSDSSASSLEDLGDGTFDAYADTVPMFVGDEYSAQVTISGSGTDSVSYSMTIYFMKSDGMNTVRDGVRSQSTYDRTKTVSGPAGSVETRIVADSTHQGWSKDVFTGAVIQTADDKDQSISVNVDYDEMPNGGKPVLSYSAFSHKSMGGIERVVYARLKKTSYQHVEVGPGHRENGDYLSETYDIAYNGANTPSGGYAGSASSFSPSMVAIEHSALGPGNFYAGHYVRLADDEINTYFTGNASVAAFEVTSFSSVQDGDLVSRDGVNRLESYSIRQDEGGARFEAGDYSDSPSLSADGSVTIFTNMYFKKELQRRPDGLFVQTYLEKMLHEMHRAFRAGDIVTVREVMIYIPLPAEAETRAHQLVDDLNQLYLDMQIAADDIRDMLDTNPDAPDIPPALHDAIWDILLRLEERYGDLMKEKAAISALVDSSSARISSDFFWRMIDSSRLGLLTRLMGLIDTWRLNWFMGGPYNPPGGGGGGGIG